MKDISVHVYFARSVVKHTVANGVNPERLMKKLRIPPNILNTPNARLSARQYADLQKNTMWAMQDEMLGYLEKPVKLGTWSAMTHWVAETNNLAQAIKRFTHFFGLFERGFQLRTSISADNLSITFSPWNLEGAPLEPYAYELFLFIFHRFICWLCDERLPIKLTSLPYPPTGFHAEYRALFWGSPLKFQQNKCSMLFERGILDKPVKRSREDIKRYLRNPLLTMLVEGYNNNSWSSRIKQVIGNDLSKLPTFELIAAEMDIHPKRLSRLLNAEGMSYSELKGELRRDTAIYLLTKKDTSIEEIAQMTGFSEASAFIRAFKGWTGLTPYSYRKDMK